METDPYKVIEDGDYVEVDADRGEIRVRKKK
jgi:anaerobic selenocysteine-containing dehydrogenase